MISPLDRASADLDEGVITQPLKRPSNMGLRTRQGNGKFVTVK